MIGVIKAIIYMLFVLFVVQALTSCVNFLFFYLKKKRDLQDKNVSDIAVKMLQCDKCGIYMSKDEAYTNDGKFYCSKDHFK